MNTVTEYQTLMAACDALVVSALTTLGKRLVRSNRSHYIELEDAGKHVSQAHLLWRADARTTAKALDNAWDDLPRLVKLHGPDDHEVDLGRLRQLLHKHTCRVVFYQLEHDFYDMLTTFREEESWTSPLS